MTAKQKTSGALLPKRILLFNRDIKEEFLDDMKKHGVPSVEKQLAVQALIAAHKAEFKAGKDLYAFSCEEAKGVFYKELRRMYPMVYSGYSALRRYCSWCIKNGYHVGKSGFLEFMPTELNEFKKRKIANPIALQGVLEQMNRVCGGNEDKYGTRFRCCVWLAYAGFPKRFLDKVSADIINFDNLSVSYGNEEPYRLCVESAKDFHAFSVIEHDGTAPLLPPGQSHYDHVDQWYERLVNDSDNNAYTTVDLSYSSISLCGLFYRMYFYERSGGYTDYRAETDEALNADMIQKIISNQDNTLNYFIDAYSRWKLAFTSF